MLCLFRGKRCPSPTRFWSQLRRRFHGCEIGFSKTGERRMEALPTGKSGAHYVLSLYLCRAYENMFKGRAQLVPVNSVWMLKTRWMSFYRHSNNFDRSSKYQILEGVKTVCNK